MAETPDKGKAGGKPAVFDALPDMSAEDLADLIAAAEQAQKAKRDDALRELRAEFHRMEADFEARAAKIGATLDDLRMPEPRPGRKGSKVPVMYRGPNGEEWSGRGKAPNWLKALEAASHSRQDFRA